ncbi:MAG: (2Fe-2S) ferredoxin domain-containing protein [Christensenellales bacterium]
MTELEVCIGSSCHIKGSYNVIQTFLQLIEENDLHDKLDMKAHFCMKECANSGICVSFIGEKYSIMPESADDFFKNVVLGKLGIS